MYDIDMFCYYSLTHFKKEHTVRFLRHRLSEKHSSRLQGEHGGESENKELLKAALKSSASGTGSVRAGGGGRVSVA